MRALVATALVLVCSTAMAQEPEITDNKWVRIYHASLPGKPETLGANFHATLTNYGYAVLWWRVEPTGQQPGPWEFGDWKEMPAGNSQAFVQDTSHFNETHKIRIRLEIYDSMNGGEAGAEVVKLPTVFP